MTSGFPWLKELPWATWGRREAPEEWQSRLKQQRSNAEALTSAPLLSLIIPVTAPPPEATENALAHFSELLTSLRAQTYLAWEAIFVSAGNLPSHKILALHDTTDAQHFRWVEMPAETSEAQLKNEGVARSRGDWWAVVDSDALLHPSALYLLGTEILQRPGADVIYTNEIELDASGREIGATLSKPHWSWVDVVHFSYLRRLVAVRREGAHHESFDPAYPHHHEADRWFRLFEQERVFRLLPVYVYYRRSSPSPGPVQEFRKVVESHLRRKGFPAHLDVVTEDRERLKVTPVLSRATDRLVSVVICFHDRAELTLKAIEAIVAQPSQVSIELILVNNRSSASELEILQQGLKRLPESIGLKRIDYPAPFNFARMNNFAVREHARGEFILFLNNDVFWQGRGTLDQMVAWSALPSVGTVGIRLLYPDGRLQHGGIIARFGGEARLARLTNQTTEDRFTRETREVFANSFAACLVRRQLFDRIGGLRELEFTNGFGDVVFNFECLRLGLKNLNLGHLTAEHLESASRGAQYEYWEEAGLEREFPDILARMLREDLGENRAPGQDIAVGQVLKEALTAKAPRLKRGLKQVGDLFSRLTQ